MRHSPEQECNTEVMRLRQELCQQKEASQRAMANMEALSLGHIAELGAALQAERHESAMLRAALEQTTQQLAAAQER